MKAVNESLIQRYTMKSNARRALAKLGQTARDAAEVLIKQDEVGFYFFIKEAKAVAEGKLLGTQPAATKPSAALDAMKAELDAPVTAPVTTEVAPVAEAVAEVVSEKAAKSVKAPKAAKPGKAPAVIQNGVRRPGKGKCADVWNELDAMRASANSIPTIHDVKALSEARGWNMNNTTIEFYGWRKFHGLNGAK